MTWNLSAEPSRFDDAVKWFSARFPVTEEIANELGDYAGPRAWKIAGVTQLDVVQEVHSSLTAAIASGIPLEEWKKSIEKTLTESWGRKDSHRIETIFRNSTQQAYNAGRWRQMHDPVVLALRPYGMFDGVDDSRITPVCKAWDGTVLPLEQFAAQGACPQLHHRCRSQIRSIRESEAKRRGITTTPPTETASEGFGAAPDLSDWQPDPTKYDPALFATFTAKQAEIAEQAKRPRIPT